ncbi:hypothetical protein [Pseudobutyrivibrio sp.]|uniref:hypothetical protein n=1 Tax=Pseudobutyrivibrio sp. TaxID=2014367 RepID=UPI0038692227
MEKVSHLKIAVVILVSICTAVALFFYAIFYDYCNSIELTGTDGYSITSYMMPELASVCRGTAIITEPRITDVYWNKKYIFATKCEAYSDTVNGYYIIEMLDDSTNVMPWILSGPMSEEEYEIKKNQLNISEKNMNYDNVFKYWWEKIRWFRDD